MKRQTHRTAAKVPTSTFNALPQGAYFRLDTSGLDAYQAAVLSQLRCKKVYDGHYIQLIDDPSGLTEETLRRSYTDFTVIPFETKENPDGRQ